MTDSAKVTDTCPSCGGFGGFGASCADDVPASMRPVGWCICQECHGTGRVVAGDNPLISMSQEGERLPDMPKTGSALLKVSKVSRLEKPDLRDDAQEE